MKIALCLSGLVGGISGRNGDGGTIHPNICAQNWKALTDFYDTDVFIHTWSEDVQDEIMTAFSPKKIIVEKQKRFVSTLAQYNHDVTSIDALKKDPRYAPLVTAYSTEGLWSHLNGIMWRSQSKYYSSKEVVKLKSDYEKENSFKYDFVFLSRFDLKFNHRFFLENLEQDAFYVSPRTDGNNRRSDYDLAYHDLYFFGNSGMMDQFSLLYDDVFEYCLSAPHAVREHLNNIVGPENIRHHSFRFGSDYTLLRYRYTPEQLDHMNRQMRNK